MPLFWRSKLLLGKRETTYGVDATPGAADSALAHNLTITPFEAGQVERNPATPYFRAPERIPVGTHIAFQFDIEAAGAGEAGTAPAYAWALRMAGLAETINAGVDAQYEPVSTGHESASLYWHMDGQRQRALGARANVAFEARANEVPMFRFQGRALYTGPTSVAIPTPDFSAYRKAKPVNNANTPTVTLHGVACVLRELSIDLGHNVAHRDRVGSESVLINGRAPTGRIVIEAPAIGTQDWFAAAKAETLGALQFIHGSGGGEIVQVDCPRVKVLNPRWVDDEDVAGLEMDLNILPVDGDDEVKFTIK